MPIDNTTENPNEDPILSDLEEQESDRLFKEQILQNPVITCAFDHCTEEEIKHCRKCGRNFCIMHANRFSPNFCKECFSNLSYVEAKFTQRIEDYNENTGQVTVTEKSRTRYYMDGPDWPHLKIWIDTLTDDELKSVWGFHYFVMKSIEAENEVRKIKKLKTKREQQAQGISTGSVKVSSKSTLKTTTVIDTAESLRKKFKKQGLPDTIIEQMIQAMNLKK